MAGFGFGSGYRWRVIEIFIRTGRMMLARWPILLSVFLAGWLAHYLLIQLAGFVGAYTGIGGFLVLPLAVIASLLSYVAMFLVLRPEMPGYQALLAAGEDAVDRTRREERRAFVDITLAAILPFFLFYAAWQLLKDDVQDYADIALGINQGRIFDGESTEGSVTDVEFGWVSISIIVVAYAGRYLLKRHSERLPRWTALVAVYLEAVWIYFFLFFAQNWLDVARTWIAGRQASVWLADAREWLGETVAPVAWLWDGIGWVINEVGAIVLLPLAWLTLAGVVLGRALARAKLGLTLRDRRIDRARERFAALPAPVARRLRDIGSDFVARWKPLTDALVLMWRAGPIQLGLYVLGSTVLVAAVEWSTRAVAVLIGPRDLTFWFAWDELIGFAVMLLWEPLRIALIAAAYDYCLRQLEQRREAVADASRGVEPATPPVARA